MFKKVLIFFTATIIIAFALLTGGEFPFLIMYVMMALIGYSILTVIRSQKNLIGIFLTNQHELEKGEVVKIKYKIYNSGFLPIPYIEVEDGISKNMSREGSKKQVYFLNAFEIYNLEKEVICEHRGIYDVGRLNVKVGELIGIYEKTFQLKEKLEIIVYPKVYKLKSFNVFGREFYGNVSTDIKYYEDYTSVKNLRKYQYGDSLKRVHWKVSAKQNQLISKNYEISSNLKLQIFLNFNEEDFKNDENGFVEECMVECVASIVKYCVEKEIEVDFSTFEKEIVDLKVKTPDMFKDFIKLCSTIKPSLKIHIVDLIESKESGVKRGSTIVVITANIDDRAITKYIGMKERGLNVAVIYVGDFNKFKENEEKYSRLTENRIKSFKLDIEDDLSEVLR